jgi:hypothetical protein
MKTAISCLSFLLALALGVSAFGVYFRCFLPWRKAPDTTHITLVFSGMQFTGWQLLIPILCLTVAAVAAGLLGLWVLKRSGDA